MKHAELETETGPGSAKTSWTVGEDETAKICLKKKKIENLRQNLGDSIINI